MLSAIAGNGPNSENNAKFIAAARKAMPELLDEVEKLRKMLDLELPNLRERVEKLVV